MIYMFNSIYCCYFTAILFRKKKCLNWDSNPRPLARQARVMTTVPAGRQFGPLNIIFKTCNNSYLCSYSRVLIPADGASP